MNDEDITFIQLTVSRCIGDGCKTEEEIAEYFKTHSLVIYSNQNEYQPNEYGDKTIKRSVTFPQSYKF